MTPAARLKFRLIRCITILVLIRVAVEAEGEEGVEVGAEEEAFQEGHHVPVLFVETLVIGSETVLTI